MDELRTSTERLLLHIRPQLSGFPDIFQFVLIDHDRHKFPIYTQRFDKRIGELFYDPSLLVGRPAFFHLEYDDRHGILFSGGVLLRKYLSAQGYAGAKPNPLPRPSSTP
jgi:hypothetical protein